MAGGGLELTLDPAREQVPRPANGPAKSEQQSHHSTDLKDRIGEPRA
jgi:hypothetical protein